MRWFSLLTIFVFLASSEFVDAQQEITLPHSYTCGLTVDSIVVDGVFDEKTWEKAPYTAYFVDIEGDERPLPKYKTRVKMAWDQTAIYFAAELEEPHVCASLTERDAIIYRDNDFEIFIDPNGDTHQYYEYEVNALNTVFDLFLVKPYHAGGPNLNTWNFKGLKSAVRVNGTLNDPSDTDQGWTVEVAIPWKAFEGLHGYYRVPNPGDFWRINFSRVHYDYVVVDGKYEKSVNPETEKMNPEYNWVWSPQGVINMHHPHRWGTVWFSDSPVGETDSLGSPADENVRQWLHQLYFDQRTIMFTQKEWNRDPQRWFGGAPEWISKHWQTDITFFEAGWEVVLRHKVDGRKWILKNDGQAWLEKAK